MIDYSCIMLGKRKDLNIRMKSEKSFKGRNYALMYKREIQKSTQQKAFGFPLFKEIDCQNSMGHKFPDQVN